MIPLPSGTKIWLVAGITDMRNGFNGLAAKVQTTLKDDPMSGHVFIFRGRNGGARRIRKKSYAKVFRASVRAETSRLPVCGSAARRNRRLG
ncbi:hypothetical protein EOK87_13895 [Escherichia coli]|nr:hypothetical protein EOK87_13895 [Escherichia coli]